MPDKSPLPIEPVAPEFSFPVDVGHLPPQGRSYTITASAEERARVAARLDLQDVEVLKAALEVNFQGGLIVVTGTVDAKVTQSCVVSLGPVPAVISEVIEASYMTEERAAKEQVKREKILSKKKAGFKASAEEEELIEFGRQDPPEVARGDRIDLGELAVVHLALALDPYPRAPGAAFDPGAWGLEAENEENIPQTSPFAALAKLKTDRAKPGKK